VAERKTTGIRRRHSKGCPAKDGGKCRCKAGYEAWVYLRREKRKVRKTFAKESEAKAWRSEASTDARNGKLRTAQKATLEQAAWCWLEAARKGAVRNRSGAAYKPGPLREYARSLEKRLLPEFGAHQLSELRRPDIQAYVDRLLTEGHSASLVRNTIDPLRAIYRHAVQRDIVAINPTRELSMPAKDGRRDRIASASEAAQLVAALPTRDQALWATAFYAGLRRGELQALRRSDVDLGRSEIHVRQAWDQYEGPIPPKSKAGVRTVPILAVLRDFLDAHMLKVGCEGDDLVFGRSASVPFAPKSVKERAERAWERVNKRVREAGDVEGREPDLLDPITLHECRHTFASLLIDAGVNAKAIQTFMGHATIEMTFSQYGHLMPGSRDQARELVDAYLEAAERKARVEAAASDPCASGAPAVSGMERFPADDERAADDDSRLTEPQSAAVDRRGTESVQV
jgi:integrase